MIKAIRYTLAAICLAASVGCLALWWRSMSATMMVTWKPSTFRLTSLEAEMGRCYLGSELDPSGLPPDWRWRTRFNGPENWHDKFGKVPQRAFVYFPLWFPALVFALASAAAIRIRRFTLRSALVGIGVVAVLLGMVVAL